MKVAHVMFDDSYPVMAEDNELSDSFDHASLTRTLVEKHPDELSMIVIKGTLKVTITQWVALIDLMKSLGFPYSNYRTRGVPIHQAMHMTSVMFSVFPTLELHQVLPHFSRWARAHKNEAHTDLFDCVIGPDSRYLPDFPHTEDSIPSEGVSCVATYLPVPGLPDAHSPENADSLWVTKYSEDGPQLDDYSFRVLKLDLPGFAKLGTQREEEEIRGGTSPHRPIARSPHDGGKSWLLSPVVGNSVKFHQIMGKSWDPPQAVGEIMEPPSRWIEITESPSRWREITPFQ